MADWLDKLEEEKQRKQREREAQREVDRVRYEESQIEVDAIYERNKELITKTFDEITRYATRASDLTTTKIKITVKAREEIELSTKMNTGSVNPDRVLEIRALSDKFSIDCLQKPDK